MNFRTFGFFGAFLSLTALAQYAVAFTCDTTQAMDEDKNVEGQTYLADCRIETSETSPFKLSFGDVAVFTAEQQIRLGPGFHAEKGSHFQADFRDCIRNPVENTGYASWGNYELSRKYPAEMWMKRIAERFVENFGSQKNHQLSVQLNYEKELASYSLSIPDFYMDYADPSTNAHVGRDDALIRIEEWLTKEDFSVRGVDKGVFFFHVGHGKPDDFDVRNGDGSVEVTPFGPVVKNGSKTDMDFQNDMRLGNCNSDGSTRGELRYLWLCSCRAFAHGPKIDGYWKLQEFQNMDMDTGFISTESRYVWNATSAQYDRPSEFDGSVDLESHRNVIERWGPVLSENFRIACGMSTSATCSGNSDNHGTMDRLARNYFDDEMSVANSWGHAFRPYWDGRVLLDSSRNVVREVRQVPLCIAKGNNPHIIDPEFRSPILDDQRFTNAANPYKGAWHIVSWEVESGGLIRKEQSIPPETLPVLYTEAKLPEWLAGYQKSLRVEGLVRVKMPSSTFLVQDEIMTSRKLTKDGRPDIKLNNRTGATILSRERKPLVNNAKNSVLSIQEYRNRAASFLDKQSWNEHDMDDLKAIRGVLQVIPVDSQAEDSIIKTQKDITFYAGRKIMVDGVSVKVFGSDNQIAIQMNNDGTVKGASKRWKKITGKTDSIPVKSYKEAYSEAVEQLSNPGLYKLSGWDWGYKSTTDLEGQGVMVVFYTFSFDPVSVIEDCISQPMIMDVQAQDVSGIARK
ncbi:MAG: hypothetical protein QNK19_14695 [Xanthomonadales bacterium]|nr:hypothetical protein [Xanthomonadales bacterium]